VPNQISEQEDRFDFASVASERFFSLVAFSSFERYFMKLSISRAIHAVSTLSALPVHVSLYLNRQMYTSLIFSQYFL